MNSKQPVTSPRTALAATSAPTPPRHRPARLFEEGDIHEQKVATTDPDPLPPINTGTNGTNGPTG